MPESQILWYYIKYLTHSKQIQRCSNPALGFHMPTGATWCRPESARTLGTGASSCLESSSISLLRSFQMRKTSKHVTHIHPPCNSLQRTSKEMNIWEQLQLIDCLVCPSPLALFSTVGDYCKAFFFEKDGVGFCLVIYNLLQSPMISHSFCFICETNWLIGLGMNTDRIRMDIYKYDIYIYFLLRFGFEYE